MLRKSRLNSYFGLDVGFGYYSFIHIPIFFCCNVKIRSKNMSEIHEKLTVFSLVIAQRLSGSEEQLGDEPAKNVLDPRLLLLLNTGLTLHMVYQQIRCVLEN